ncbi:MAG TPA: PEP-CTERM sorting domain-containing protein [Rhizomicrobium sp.]|jgi:hypothetical protein
MKKIFGILSALIISSAFSAIAAQPAVAAVIDLNLESFSFSDSNVIGIAPHIADNGASVNTSNAGNVTTVSLPYTFAFTGTGASLTPTHPLFVVEPQNNHGTSTATIQVTFNFQYDGTNLALPEKVNYYADANDDTDTLIWQAGTNGTCDGSKITSHCTYDFTIDGQAFSIEMDNETDWNMAEFDAASVNMGPVAVPEPFTLSLFGAGIAGAVAMRRRKAKA